MPRLLATIGLASVMFVLAACGGRPTTAPPTVTAFTATPTTIGLGAPVTLVWTVDDATSIVIEPDVGDVTTAAGNASTGYPLTTTEYTLTARNDGGEVSRKLTITVNVPDPPDPDEVIVPETTKVTDGATRSLLQSYDDTTGTLRFSDTTPALLEVAVGDVIVSEPTEAAPFGFLRRVTQVRSEGGQFVLETDEASLEEAIEQADFDVEWDLDPDDVVEAEALLEGMSFGYDDVTALGVDRQALRFGITFDRSIFDQDGDASTTDDQVRISGAFNFSPKVQKSWKSRLEVTQRCRWICLPEFTLRLEARLAVGFDQSANLTIRTTGPLGGSMATEIPIARYSFSAITFAIGPVPVVLVPQITLVVGASGEISAHASFRVDQSLTYLVGAEYNGGLRTINTFTPSFTRRFEDFSHGSFRARAYITASANVTFYGSSSNYVGASAMGYLEVDARVPRSPAWTLHAGVECRVRYSLRVWRLSIGRGEARVCNVRRELARGEVRGPHVLTVTRVGSGAGRVTSSPGGIDCGSTCSHAFAAGTQVTLTPTPLAGSTFAGWTGACTGTGACVVTADAAKTVTATFDASIATLTITRSGMGQGRVTSTPAGIDCGSTCSHDFVTGTQVVLAATPEEGSVFNGWSGACGGTASCTTTLTTGATAAATFSLMSPSSGTVSVRVTDAATADPVRSVSILVCTEGDECFAPAIKEPSPGNYGFDVPAGPTHHLEFSKTGYVGATYRGLVVPAAGETVHLEQLLFVSEAESRTGSAGGTVTDAVTGAPVAGVAIGLRHGVNTTSGVIVAATTTAGAGGYGFGNLPAGNYTAEASRAGYITAHFSLVVVGGETKGGQNAAISPDLPADQWRVVLTWGDEPADLDAHLTGSGVDDDDGRLHVYWYRKTYEIGDFVYAQLDVDAVAGYGPETVTIFHAPDGERFNYFVHDYSNRSSVDSRGLADSRARVRVFRGNGLVRTFDVPNEAGTLWKVFTLIDDPDAVNLVLRPIHEMSHHEIPDEIDD